MAITNREIIQPGLALTAKYKGETYRAVVIGNIGPSVEVVDGPASFAEKMNTPFKTLSAAGSAIMGGTACNGWRFWSVDESAPLNPVLTPKPAKARSSKMFRRVPGTGLPEGEKRFWCLACQKSFITTDAEPQACPEGHKIGDPVGEPVMAEA